MSVIKEKYMKGSLIPVNIKSTEIILEQMKKCVCKIHDKNGTGFFVKIPFNQKKIGVLITNNHILDEDDIETGKRIILSLNNEEITKKIIIYSKRKKYTNKKLDVTIIEIFEEQDDIKDFLNLSKQIENQLKLNNLSINDFDNIYKDESIYLLNYIKAQEIVASFGLLQNINDDKITHKCNTLGGSSGSPIILLEDQTVIGVHYGSNSNSKYNLGTLLINPILEFQEKNESIKINEISIKDKTKYNEIMYHDEDFDYKSNIKNISEQINKSYGNEIAKLVELSYQVKTKDAFKDGIVIGTNSNEEEVKVYKTKDGKYSFKNPKEKLNNVNDNNNIKIINENQEYDIDGLAREIETLLNANLDVKNIHENDLKNNNNISINKKDKNHKLKFEPAKNLIEQLSNQINAQLDDSIQQHKQNLIKIKEDLEAIKVDENIANLEEDNKEENFDEIKNKFEKFIGNIDCQKLKDISLAISYIEKMNNLLNDENKIQKKIIIVHCLEKMYKRLTGVIIKKEVIVKKKIKGVGVRYERAFTKLSEIVRKYNNYLKANLDKKNLKDINQWINTNLSDNGELEQFVGCLRDVLSFESEDQDDDKLNKEFGKNIRDGNYIPILSRISKLNIKGFDSLFDSFNSIYSENINSKNNIDKIDNINPVKKEKIKVKSKVYIEEGKKRKSTNLDFTSKNFLASPYHGFNKSKSIGKFSSIKNNNLNIKVDDSKKNNTYYNNYLNANSINKYKFKKNSNNDFDFNIYECKKFNYDNLFGL